MKTDSLENFDLEKHYRFELALRISDSIRELSEAHNLTINLFNILTLDDLEDLNDHLYHMKGFLC